ncbi:amino acid transporter AVT1J-like [Euphorbia lathyris]|uniref:amino acid transporter AVT1J-like n=1 Tax=Euphorbia lathyris TaxID=212925 RepID=UPI00331371B0
MESKYEDGSLTRRLISDEAQDNGLKHQDSESGSENHSTEGTASSFKTILNGFNALSGVGILSTPYALASGGWLSLIFFFIIAIVGYYSGVLIQRCMEKDQSILTFSDIGGRAFGNKGRIWINIIMCLELYLVATGFLIVEGDNLHNLFPKVNIEVAGLSFGGTQSFILISALIILPTIWLDDLSILSYISATGVVASFVILGSIFWVGAFDGVGFHEKGELIKWSGMPTAVSLYSFCYCAHPVFPTIYTSMKKKHQFSYVLVICFILCTFTYAATAIFGYLMFGPDVQSQITLDLPTSKISSKIAIYTTLINPLAKYALMVKPILDAAKTRFQYKKPLSMVTSTILLVTSVMVALCLPFFGDLMSLVGAFLSLTGSIIIPCLCYLKISGTYKRLTCELVVVGGIIGIAVMVVILGTYTAVLQILGHF